MKTLQWDKGIFFSGDFKFKLIKSENPEVKISKIVALICIQAPINLGRATKCHDFFGPS